MADEKEWTSVRLRTAHAEELKAFSKREGLSPTDAVAHLLAAYAAPKEVVQAKAVLRGRGSKVAPPTSKKDYHAQMMAQRAEQAGYLSGRAPVEAVRRVDPAVRPDMCEFCGVVPGMNHKAICRRLLMGTVYEGRPLAESVSNEGGRMMGLRRPADSRSSLGAVILLALASCNSDPSTPRGMCFSDPVLTGMVNCEDCRFSEDESMLCCPTRGTDYEPAHGRTPDKVFPDGTETVQRRVVWLFHVADGVLAFGHGGWVLQPTPKSLRPEDWGCPNWTPGT